MRDKMSNAISKPTGKISEDQQRNLNNTLLDGIKDANPEAVKKAIKGGAKVNFPTNYVDESSRYKAQYKSTPLSNAISLSKYDKKYESRKAELEEIASILEEKGGKTIEVLNQDLKNAILGHDLGKVKEVVEAGANVNFDTSDYAERRMLTFAKKEEENATEDKEKCQEIAEYLESKGAKER